MKEREPNFSEPVFFSPVSDWGFHRIFGNPANSRLLKFLLNTIIDDKNILTVTLRDPNHQYLNVKGGKSVFDVYCTCDDGTNIICLVDNALWPQTLLRAGDIVEVRGQTSLLSNRHVNADCLTIVWTGHEPLPAPPERSIRDLRNDRGHPLFAVRVRGTVRDVFRDEIDSRWIFFTVNCQGYPIYAAIKESDGGGRDFKALADAEVSITGVCDPPGHYGYRKLIGRIITVFGADDIRTLLPAASDPFSVPEIETPSDRLAPFAITVRT